MIGAVDMPFEHRLSVLLRDLTEIDPAGDRTVRGLALDHRRVRAGDLFLACAGGQCHGAQFIPQAIAAGAVAVAWEPPCEAVTTLPGQGPVPLIAVPELRRRVGVIADRYYGQPSRALQVVGVTGTNGKTSCSHFLAQALHEDAPCGLIGTLGTGLFGELAAAAHTTPDAVTVQATLAAMRAAGAGRAVMEVSSHGLDQGRVAGVHFTAALFTNLTRDHLDYHRDMGRYGQAKRALFESPELAYAVVNLDDPFGRELAATLPAGPRLIGYSLAAATAPKSGTTVHGRLLHQDQAGMRLQVTSPWGEGTVTAPLIGAYNASNLLGVLSVLLALQVPFAIAAERLARLAPVPGRLERFGGSDQPMVVVDYAHTPDALEQALRALQPLVRGRLWCVFGCGGERDAGKRPLMGAAAERLADRVVITDDNPRGEDPMAIVADIRAGLARPDAAAVIRDRAAAIRHAVEQALPGDVVLIAGKGHEQTQSVAGRVVPFSDRDVVRALLEEGGA